MGVASVVIVKKKYFQVAEIYRMAVSSQYQRLSIGQKLLQVAIQFAENEHYKNIILATSYNQQQARRFYERNGFVVVSTFYEWDFYCIPFYHYIFQFILDEFKSL